MLKDLIRLYNFLKYQKKIKRIFFFENSFVESHLEPYICKNKIKNDTAIISLYKIKNSRLKEYRIFQVKSIFILNIFFLLLKTKYCYSTTPDINYTAFKRSVFKKTKYIYIQHSPLGLTKIYRNNAFTQFDVVQVVNSFQENDLININKIKNKNIKIWRGQYLFMNKSNSNSINKKNFKKKILIAPTWGTSFFDDKTHILIRNNLDNKKYEVFIRPHAMSISKKNISISDLLKDNFIIMDGKIDFNKYDILITDWSGIYIEFAKFNLIKSVLIQNNEKILNKEFNNFENKPIDFVARNILGEIVTLDDINNIQNIIENILKNKDNYRNEINNFFDRHFY